MQYVVCKRFKERCLCGNVNLPYGTICETTGDVITLNGKELVTTFSNNAYKYFARNNDGMGLERGKYIAKITELLRTPTKKSEKEIYDKRWAKIWKDKELAKFRRPEHRQFWVWNYDFYNAEISDLEYILNLISEEK